MRPQPAGARDKFLRASNPVRLDAFENYIRGVLATTRQDKIRRFSEAVRLNPNYFAADLQLGRTYLAARELRLGGGGAGQDSRQRPGIERSELPARNQLLLSRAVRQIGHRVQGHPGETAAGRGLQQSWSGRQSPRQARRFGVLPAGGRGRRQRRGLSFQPGRRAGKERRHSPPPRRICAKPCSASPTTSRRASSSKSLGSGGANRLPLTRIKRNYDESSYKLLALEVQNAMEQTLANADPRTRGTYHAEHARQLLESGLARRRRERVPRAIVQDPANPDAHLGLARVAELNSNAALARSEAQTALRLKPSAEAYLVLARLALKENNLTEAAQNADQALWLEPSNAAAFELKHRIK
jgi:tetratricopeptide (TPR) repeat protein